MGIVARISEKAVQKGITIASIELQLGFGKNTIYKWDKSIPSAKKLYDVANLLDTSMDFLMNGTDIFPNLTPDQQELLTIFNRLSPETQRDFLGAMRLHADLHDVAETEEKLREAK